MIDALLHVARVEFSRLFWQIADIGMVEAHVYRIIITKNDVFVYISIML